MTLAKRISNRVTSHGLDILLSDNMQIEKECIQHGNISVYWHSFFVACMSLLIAKTFRMKVDERSLVRGALLHDYFLYDWHVKDDNHFLHGFRHAKRSLKNAERDFELNDIEKDIILKHMFPLNITTPPLYKESTIVCIADKICATLEIVSVLALLKAFTKGHYFFST